MAAEFVDYKKAPGFWFHIGMILASDISLNPKLSAKYMHDQVDYDIFAVFDAGMARYIRNSKRGNFSWYE